MTDDYKARSDEIDKTPAPATDPASSSDEAKDIDLPLEDGDANSQPL